MLSKSFYRGCLNLWIRSNFALKSEGKVIPISEVDLWLSKMPGHEIKETWLQSAGGNSCFMPIIWTGHSSSKGFKSRPGPGPRMAFLGNGYRDRDFLALFCVACMPSSRLLSLVHTIGLHRDPEERVPPRLNLELTSHQYTTFYWPRQHGSWPTHFLMGICLSHIIKDTEAGSQSSLKSVTLPMKNGWQWITIA